MRFLNTTLLLSALGAASLARPALADGARAGRGPAPPATPLTVLSARPSAAAPARLAPSAPLKLDLWPGAGPSWLWATPRAHMASLGPVGPLSLHPRLWGSWGSPGSSRPLRVAGGVVLGLGLLALFGAGVTGIVAAASAAGLDSECPGKVCYEDSIGGRSLERARGAALAADWLVGIGAPVTASGTVMMLYSAVVERYASAPLPVFRASPGGGGLTFHF